MPRPKPSHADEPVPGSVSLARKLRVAGARLKAARPALGLQDFSDLLTRALSDYLERHYPGFIAEVERELLAPAARLPAPAAMRAVAEDGASFGDPAASGPTVDEMIAGEVARRNRKKPIRGGGARVTAKSKTAHGRSR